jgi:two-component system, NarL family, uhpT operon response regulator UhpA
MRIFLVDGQPVFREGLKQIISGANDLRVVGDAEGCQNLSVSERNFELLILDGELDSLPLIESLHKERRIGRSPFTLVISERSGPQFVAQLLRAGADGYLVRSSPTEVILAAIRRVGAGGKYIDPSMAEKLLFTNQSQPRSTGFSIREYQVLQLIASGLRAKEIAGKLFLSVKTVSTYRSRILAKLNLSSNADLIRYALTEEVID